MADPQPTRPWWKKKRWLAAAILWLALPIVYVFACGGAAYALGRDWISNRVYADSIDPAWKALSCTPWLPEWLAYNQRCYALGAAHYRAAHAPERR